MGIADHGSVLHYGSGKVFVAVKLKVDIGEAASDVSVHEGYSLVCLRKCCMNVGAPVQIFLDGSTLRYSVRLTLSGAWSWSV